MILFKILASCSKINIIFIKYLNDSITNYFYLLIYFFVSIIINFLFFQFFYSFLAIHFLRHFICSFVNSIVIYSFTSYFHNLSSLCFRFIYIISKIINELDSMYLLNEILLLQLLLLKSLHRKPQEIGTFSCIVLLFSFCFASPSTLEQVFTKTSAFLFSFFCVWIYNLSFVALFSLIYNTVSSI